MFLSRKVLWTGQEQRDLFFLYTAPLLLCRVQEVMCFNAKLKILEHRQQRIAEVRAKYEWLMKELEMTKQYLMLDPNKWLRECKAQGSFLSLWLTGSPATEARHLTQGDLLRTLHLGADGDNCSE